MTRAAGPRRSLALVCLIAGAWLAGTGPAAAAGQHPATAAQQAPPVARQVPPAKGDTPAAGTPASLEEVAKRITAVLAEQAGHSSKEGETAPSAATHRPKPAPGRSTPARTAPAKKASLATLTWDPALTSGGVALAWDEQLDPRRSAELGIRLVWPPAPAQK